MLVSLLMRHASFYAVARGKSVGIFNTWQKCRKSVDGFSGAKYKKFPTIEQANEFVELYHGTTTINGENVMLTGQKEKFGECSANKSIIAGVDAAGFGVEGDDLATIVYTDGACSRNGFIGAKAGFGVFWSDGHPDNVSAPVIGPPTNNRAEYLAVIAALDKAKKRNICRLVIRTDSALLIQSMTQWLPNWRRNGWKTSTGTDVRNRDLLERIDKLSTGNIDVKFEKVMGHSGDYGNDQADLLARRGAEQFTSKE